MATGSWRGTNAALLHGAFPSNPILSGQRRTKRLKFSCFAEFFHEDYQKQSRVWFSVTLIWAAIKKNIEWRLQVQIALLTDRHAKNMDCQAVQRNVAWGLKFRLPFDEKITLKIKAFHCEVFPTYL
jgi:hypothetical protein